MDLGLITKLEKIYAQTTGILEQNKINYFVMGGFCLYKNPFYREFITQYSILNTFDIDIKVVLTYNEEDSEEYIVEYKKYIFDLLYKISVNIYFQHVDEGLQISTTKDFTIFQPPFLDMLVYHKSNIPIISSYLKSYDYTIEHLLSLRDQYKCTNSSLTEYNVVYLYILLFKSIQLKKYSNRMLKAGSVLAKFYLILIGINMKTIEEGHNIFSFFQTLQEKIEEIKNKTHKIEYLYSNINNIKSIFDIEPTENVINAIFTSHTYKNIIIDIEKNNPDLIMEQHAGKIYTNKKFKQNELIKELVEIYTIYSHLDEQDKLGIAIMLITINLKSN